MSTSSRTATVSLLKTHISGHKLVHTSTNKYTIFSTNDKTPGPPGHPKTCLSPLPYQLHQAWQKTLHPLDMEKDLPPRALVRQAAGMHPAQRHHDVHLEILWGGMSYILVYTGIYQYIQYSTILYRHILCYCIWWYRMLVQSIWWDRMLVLRLLFVYQGVYWNAFKLSFMLPDNRTYQDIPEVQRF